MKTPSLVKIDVVEDFARTRPAVRCYEVCIVAFQANGGPSLKLITVYESAYDAIDAGHQALVKAQGPDLMSHYKISSIRPATNEETV